MRVLKSQGVCPKVVYVDDGCCNIAFIKGPPRRIDGLITPATACGLLLVHKELERAPEVRLHKEVPRFRQRPARRIYFRRPRQFFEIVEMRLHRFDHEWVHWEAVARQAYGGFGNLTEAVGSELLQGGEPDIWCGRHHGVEDAARDKAVVVLAKIGRIQALRLGADTDEVAHLAVAGHA